MRETSPSGRRPRRRGAVATAATVAVAVVLGASGCGLTRRDDDRDLAMWIPNSPGGGYDQTGRAAVGVLESEDITGGSLQVTNILGASGSVALTRLMSQEGDEHLLMTVGLGVVGASYSFAQRYQVADATPIAQLIEDQEAVLVPADSPYRTFADFARAWKADPSGMVVGGGSSPGGPDHLFPMQLADELGIDPRVVQRRYVAYDGGGPLTSALLGGKIDAGFSGLGEFEGQIESGDLRALAVSGEERLDGDVLGKVPTLTESDVDLVFTNWRGLIAPPGISEERRDELIAYVERMHDTAAWRRVLARNGWIDELKTGDDFGVFLREQDARVADTLKEVGLL